MRIEKSDSKQRECVGQNIFLMEKLMQDIGSILLDQYSSVGIMVVNFICQPG